MSSWPQLDAYRRSEAERWEGVIVEIPKPAIERLTSFVDSLAAALRELRDVTEEVQYGIQPVEEERLARAVLNATTVLNEVEGRG